MKASPIVYDQIGTGYAGVRRADPRFEASIASALGPGRLLNVGAGAGSYEPRDRPVVAVEPSDVMIDQRPAEAGPVVRATAEELPFGDSSFDVTMAILTVHHWVDWSAGLRELVRVAPRRVVLTFDPEVHGAIWLMDYLPEIAELDSQRAPSIAEVGERIDGISVTVVPVPGDCLDGMTVAYWRRPEAFLDPEVRRGSSSLRQVDAGTLRRGLSNLERDLRRGVWHDRYGHLLELDELDCGLRLIVGEDRSTRSAGTTA